jgi:DNA polymerase I-like protein with 3'-5' exonuclease and polymerase domains
VTQLPEHVRIVAVDTETSGLHQDDGARVSTVVLSWRANDGALVKLALPFDQGRLSEKMPYLQMDLFEDVAMDPNLPWEVWDALADWLSSRDLLIMHNGKFDLHMLEAGTRHFPGFRLDSVEVWDTLVAEHVLSPGQPVGLDATGERRGFGGKVGKNPVVEWLASRKLPKGRYDLVPWDVMEPYALGDGGLTLEVSESQMDEFEEQDLWVSAKNRREQKLMRVLQKIERRGIPYDAARSSDLADKIEARIAELEKTRPFPNGTLAGARDWFFSRCGAKVVHRTEAGLASLDEQTTRRMILDGIPWAAEFAEIASLKTSLTMWYRGYADKTGQDGRLRTSFRQTKVVSGRMSVERVNLQAIPKVNKRIEKLLGPGHSVRSLIAAQDGRELFNLDLQQAELRVAAKYARCTPMLEMLANGDDLHSITTKEVLGVDESHPDWKLKRDTGKRLTFSSIFQIGGLTLQENLARVADIHLPLAECNRMVQRWRAKYPEYGDAYRKAEQLAKKRGWVWLLKGTPHESKSYFGEFEFHNTAWSRMVQGSLAEALKLWLIAAEDAYPEAMVLTVHDSIVVEFPKDQAEIVAHGIALLGGNLLTELFNTSMMAEADRWRS